MVNRRNSAGINAQPVSGSKRAPTKTDVITWLRTNIFDGVFNSLLSLSILALTAIVLWDLVEWALINSVWNAESFTDCREKIIAAHGAEAQGACWTVLKGRIGLLLFGFYPLDQHWRPITAFFLLLVAVGPVVFKSLPRVALLITAVYPAIAYVLIWGGFGLVAVDSHAIGGLLLTVIIATAGFTLAIPIGIAPALGRHFLFLPLRSICAAIIALLRGVPLLVLLFATVILASIFYHPGNSLTQSSV